MTKGTKKTIDEKRHWRGKDLNRKGWMGAGTIWKQKAGTGGGAGAVGLGRGNTVQKQLNGKKGAELGHRFLGRRRVIGRGGHRCSLWTQKNSEMPSGPKPGMKGLGSEGSLTAEEY